MADGRGGVACRADAHDDRSRRWRLRITDGIEHPSTAAQRISGWRAAGLGRREALLR